MTLMKVWLGSVVFLQDHDGLYCSWGGPGTLQRLLAPDESLAQGSIGSVGVVLPHTENLSELKGAF